MDSEELQEQVLATWRKHQEILLFLLSGIPAAGFAGLPHGSRGRDVARQFAHLDRVRQGWLHYHRTGKRLDLPRGTEGPRPTRARLRTALAKSGKAIERHLADALAGKARTRSFGGQPVRWMGYLIAHESHHRGQILLALKQSGVRMPPKVSLEGMWGKWMFGG